MVNTVGLVQKLGQVWPLISYQYSKQSYDKKNSKRHTNCVLHCEHDIFFSANAELGSHSSCWIGVVVRSRYIGVGQEISSGNSRTTKRGGGIVYGDGQD